jgi:hypothetical protein
LYTKVSEEGAASNFSIEVRRNDYIFLPESHKIINRSPSADSNDVDLF